MAYLPFSEITRGLKIPCSCDSCNIHFTITLRNYNRNKKRKQEKIYCSPGCASIGNTKEQNCKCTKCGILFIKKLTDIKRTNNNFCSSSCSASFNNTHKKYGNRRSKLELFLEQKLLEKYPLLDICYNDKTTIKSELDIYIPSLKIAFELNGIFHYKPIFGKDKLSKIQNNDDKKRIACIEQGIELHTIDCSELSYFTDKKAEKYFDTLCFFINRNY